MGQYDTFTNYLQKDFGTTLDKIHEAYGETLEDHQRSNSDKKVSMLILIAIDNFVLSEDIASILGISIATVNRFLKNFKELGLIARVGSYKTGYWQFCS